MATETPRIFHFDAATGVGSERPLTEDELTLMMATATEAYAEAERQQPLAPSGALATLLVVEGVLPLTHAANAVGVNPEDLIAEANAWAAAQEFETAEEQTSPNFDIKVSGGQV